jgi:hypothetical protein
MRRALFLGFLPLPMALALACGGGQPPVQEATTAPGGTKNQAQWPEDDRSMCVWKNRTDVEVSETAGPGAMRPNIRRVFKAFGDSDTRHKTLICREVDTNLDGIKDVVRHFDPKGEPVKEEQDTDYDGKIDVWLAFSGGRLVQAVEDTNADGKPDVWKYYTNGQLTRIKRDKNFDGKPDVWEIYAKGRLERMGIDVTGDGHVDRWDRDEQLRLQQESDEEEARRKMAGDAGAGSSGGGVAADAGAASGDGGVKSKRNEPR